MYEGREGTRPESYRPVTLLLHLRKMVESTITAAIRKEYCFIEIQLGFQAETATETALIRHIANTHLIRIATVIDLKWAYYMETIRRLYETVKAS